MHLLGLLLIAFLTTTADAGTYDDANGKKWIITEPPQRYINTYYGGTIDIKAMPEARIRSYCYQITGKNDPHGCSLTMPHYCLIAISDRLPLDFRAAVLRHEEAHCRGWPADHPTD